MPGSKQAFSRGRWPSSGIAEMTRDFSRSKHVPPGGKTSNTVAQFALDFERKESVCGGYGHRA
jgi:hypothetical protein